MHPVRIVELKAADALAERGAELDALAEAQGSIFSTSAWLDAWTRAFAPDARYILAIDTNGALLAAACVTSLRLFGTASAANLETGDWTVTGTSKEARRRVWRHLAERGGGRLRLIAVPDTEQSAGEARAVLTDAGYRVAHRGSVENPRLELPGSWDDLLASISRNARSQYRRRRAAFNELGRVELRTADSGSLDADLRSFFQLEGGGWKGEAKTSIASNPKTLSLYRRFAENAARQGWLRLQLLEVDGVPVAADLSSTFAGGVFMLKTAYDERLARLSPGLVLRGEALQSAIRDGLRFWDFLGMRDAYKLRWGSVVQPHLTISAHRGAVAPVAHRYHAQLRPDLKIARSAVQARIAKLRSSKDPLPGEASRDSSEARTSSR